MKTETLTKNADSHNNVNRPADPPPGALPAIAHQLQPPAPLEETQAPENGSDDSPSPDSSSLALARSLLPPSLRDRKFRADSFMAELNPIQFSILHAWLSGSDSIETIRQKIAAPPPAGFGLNVCANTLYRLRSQVENDYPCGLVMNAMETAQDVLEHQDAADPAPIREALSLMLYSRAIYAAKKDAAPEALDKLLSVITKLEKLKDRAAQPRPSRKKTASPPATRHIVELTVTPAPAKVVNISSVQ